MTVDEVLADPAAATEVPPNAMVTHVIVIVEYLEPASADEPSLPRMDWATDDLCGTHLAEGMLRRAYREIVAASDTPA